MTMDDRVLVLMPTAKDGERTQHALAEAGLEVVVCHDLDELAREIAPALPEFLRCCFENPVADVCDG